MGPRPAPDARRMRWALLAAGGLLTGSLTWILLESGTPRESVVRPPEGPSVARRGTLLAVRGNPGWDALPEDEKRRAETPLSGEAIAWLRAERETVRRVAASFDVSPVALGGLVAAEKTLLTGRVDALGEELFRTVLGSLPERDLERWVETQESAYRRGTLRPGRGGIRNPYLWTLGPAQVSFRLAIQYEAAVADRLGRPRRGVKEVLDAVTTVPGNLEYAAALLAEGEADYREMAGFDLRRNPGVLATLYHLGSPAVRARKLAAENALRRSRGEPIQPPHVNYYGAFVNRNAEEIAEILGAGRAPAELGIR